MLNAVTGYQLVRARESDMTAFSTFLTELLREGRVVFRSGEPPRDRPTERDLAILAEAFAAFALSVAGPPIAFDPRIAGEAAEIVRQASWALVDRGERPAGLKRRLRIAETPATPAHHLSADLLLRYLPQLMKRARGLDPTDALVEILGGLLRPVAALGRTRRNRGRSARVAEFRRPSGATAPLRRAGQRPRSARLASRTVEPRVRLLSTRLGLEGPVVESVVRGWPHDERHS